MLGGDLGDRLVVEQLALPERAPRLGDDAVLGVLAPELGLRKPGVKLDLVDGRRDAGGVDDRLDVLYAEVGDADRRPWLSLASLVVMNTSSRSRPLWATASPMPASLRYMAAVSIDR
jgi:hypothetical protein